MVIIILYILVIPFLILNAVRDDFEEHLLRVMLISVPVLGIAINSEEKESRKNPLYVKLPVSVRQIGIARNMLWISFWISLVILLGFSILINKYASIKMTDLWLILTIAGLMIILGASTSIVQDLRFCFQGKILSRALRMCLVLIPIIAAVIYLCFSISGSVRVYLARRLLMPWSSILMGFIAAGLVVLSVIVFERRKSYLE